MRKLMTALGGLVLAGCVAVAACGQQSPAPGVAGLGCAPVTPSSTPVVTPPKPAESLEDLFKSLTAAKAEQKRQEKAQSDIAERIAAIIKSEKEKLKAQMAKLEEMEKLLTTFTAKAPDSPPPPTFGTPAPSTLPPYSR